MELPLAREKLLDAAEDLFYSRGIQSVGMDELRAASGLSLKRIYQLYPDKEHLVEGYLERRDARWRGSLADHVARLPDQDPDARILEVFDWLGAWFAEPGFRGCAWINSHGELGAVSATVATQARRHKAAFRRYLGTLVADAGRPDALADDLRLLAEGAMVTAGIFGTTEPAAQARAAAARLLSSVKPL
jgi:AcrR family transcriptional regulator